jgi:hypothetical protein
MLRRIVRRVVPFLLVLVAAVPDAALAGQWYRCTYTGATRDTCCCPDEGKRSESAQPGIQRADCCDLLRNQPTTTPARVEARADLSDRAAPALVALPARVALLATAEERAAPRDRRATAPPPPREPVYIRHAALLL